MTPTTVSDLFAAVDISSFTGNMGTLYLAGIGLMLLGIGFRLVKKGAKRSAGAA